MQVHTRYRMAGGEDTAVSNEQRLLREAGHHVEEFLEQNPEGPLPASMALAQAMWNKRAAERVLNRARESRIDLIHVHNTWFALTPAVFPVLAAAGFPLVATMHNYRQACVNAMLYREGAPCEDCVGRLPWRGVVRRCYRDSAVQSAMVASTVVVHSRRKTWQRDIHVVIALTKFAADLLVRSGIPASRIEIKPNVVPDVGGRVVAAEESDRVLFVGRLAEEKGIGDLVAAWQRRPPQGLRLDIVGEGPLRETLSSGAGVSVRGPLSKPEVADLMLTSRALVVPSRWYEGQPMVILEALASGLPVVVPDLGALPETAGNGGVVFRASDPNRMMDTIGRLREDRLVAEMSRAARLEYELRYSERVGLGRLEEIYSLARDRAAAG